MTVTTIKSRQQRRNRLATTLAAGLITGCLGTSAGCSSSVGTKVASLNPFASKPAASNSAESPGWLNAPKKVASKSRDTFAGWFGGKKERGREVVAGDETDPTSLAHKAEVTSEVFVANGRLWESTGNFEKAMESYAKALQKDPDDPAALANIARLHFRQNNHEKAAEYFGKAIKQKPDDPGLYNDLGLTLSKLGNHGAAATTIEQALRLSPGSSRFANNLASVKFESGDPGGAMEVLVKNNKPAVAHFNMAYLHYKHGQAAEATRHLNQAMVYQPQAESDPATRRAVERSQELLAQIGNLPGMAPGTAIASQTTAPVTNPPASAPATAAGTATAAATKPTAQIANAAVRQASQGTVDSAAAAKSAAVQPASTDATSVQFGSASFKTSTGTDAPQATPVSGPQMPHSEAESTAPASGSQFSLPPGF